MPSQAESIRRMPCTRLDELKVEWFKVCLMPRTARLRSCSLLLRWCLGPFRHGLSDVLLPDELLMKPRGFPQTI